MNTIDTDRCQDTTIWHERMVQGCQEVIHRLTILLLRLQQRELMRLDESTPLTLFVEAVE